MIVIAGEPFGLAQARLRECGNLTALAVILSEAKDLFRRLQFA